MVTLTKDLEAQIAARLRRVENPDWYTELLGVCLEATGGDAARSLRLADQAYRERPHPPADPQDRELKRLADTLALAGVEEED